MSEDTKVQAELRESFGKGFARRLRAAGKIPAVIYGHGTEPVHVALPGHQVSLIIRRANALLELDIEGKSQLALVKDVQRDPVHQIIEHIDLLVVKKGEKVTIDVPIVVTGESAAGTIVNLDATTLSIEAEATHIPQTSRSRSRAWKRARTSPARREAPQGLHAALRPRGARRRDLRPGCTHRG